MRAPFNSLVIPFYREPGAPTLYCVLRRADAGFWQWVAGGGEDSETALEAAIRETREETGIEGPLYRLQSEARVPTSAFAAREHWPDDLYVIPEYHFAVEAPARRGHVLSEDGHGLRLAPLRRGLVAAPLVRATRRQLQELAERPGRRGDLRPRVESPRRVSRATGTSAATGVARALGPSPGGSRQCHGACGRRILRRRSRGRARFQSSLRAPLSSRRWGLPRSFGQWRGERVQRS